MARSETGAGGEPAWCAVSAGVLYAGETLSRGRAEPQLSHDLGSNLRAGEPVRALEEAALDQRGDGGRRPLDLELAPQLLRLGLTQLDRAAEDRRLEVRALEVRQLFAGGQRAEQDERAALEAGRQHQRDAVEERGEVVVAEPAGQLDMRRREVGPHVNHGGDVAGLRDRSSLARLNNDALECTRAEGDVHRLTGLNREAVGNAISERLAEGSGGVDRYFSEGHCGASIASGAAIADGRMA